MRLCRWKSSGEYVAIKKLKKEDILTKNHVQQLKAERDLLIKSFDPWIVKLYCTFQDEKYLYLVMEYLPGGDLMSLLMKKEILTEEEGRFYIAEAVRCYNEGISYRISS